MYIHELVRNEFVERCRSGLHQHLKRVISQQIITASTSQHVNFLTPLCQSSPRGWPVPWLELQGASSLHLGIQSHCTACANVIAQLLLSPSMGKQNPASLTWRQGFSADSSALSLWSEWEKPRVWLPTPPFILPIMSSLAQLTEGLYSCNTCNLNNLCVLAMTVIQWIDLLWTSILRLSGSKMNWP